MGESRYFQANDPQRLFRGSRFQGHAAERAEPVLSGAQYRPDARLQQSWTPPSYFDDATAYTPQAGFGMQDAGFAASSPPAYGAVPPPEHVQPAPARTVQTGAVLHGLGAVLSVALLLGGVGWMWQMMQRDVAGVPVVRALEGPLREAPADPGGRQAAHQGLSINEVTGTGAAQPREQIVLAPPPLDLEREDMSGQAASGLHSDPTPALLNQPIPVALQQPAAPSANSSALGINSPTRRAVANSPRPPARGNRRPAATSTQLAAFDASTPQASQPIAHDLASSVADSVVAGLSGLRDIDVDPATIGPGTRLVQLGAYDDIAAARAAWDTLAGRFSPLLDDRGRVIEAAHSGGSVFYRLRAHGFTDERDARRFCAALVDQQIDCIPVLIR